MGKEIEKKQKKISYEFANPTFDGLALTDNRNSHIQEDLAAGNLKSLKMAKLKENATFEAIAFITLGITEFLLNLVVLFGAHLITGIGFTKFYVEGYPYMLGVFGVIMVVASILGIRETNMVFAIQPRINSSVKPYLERIEKAIEKLETSPVWNDKDHSYNIDKFDLQDVRTDANNLADKASDKIEEFNIVDSKKIDELPAMVQLKELTNSLEQCVSDVQKIDENVRLLAEKDALTEPVFSATIERIRTAREQNLTALAVWNDMASKELE